MFSFPLDGSEYLLKTAQGLLRTAKVGRKQVHGSGLAKQVWDSRGQSDLAQEKKRINLKAIVDIY